MASRSSAVPATGVYLVKLARMAAMAASLMCSGVAKCGSPAPKSTRSAPFSRSLVASITTAMVAEISMRSMRSERTLLFTSLATGMYAPYLDLLSDPANFHRRCASQFLLQPLLHQFRHQAFNRAAELRDLPHQA